MSDSIRQTPLEPKPEPPPNIVTTTIVVAHTKESGWVVTGVNSEGSRIPPGQKLEPLMPMGFTRPMGAVAVGVALLDELITRKNLPQVIVPGLNGAPVEDILRQLREGRLKKE